MLIQVDNSIRELATTFLRNPLDYFQEREAHSTFFCICRKRFGSANTKGNPSVEVSLFRQEYNTIWRLVRGESFAERYDSIGKPGSLDFAILRADFVEKNGLLCIVNKDENIRKAVREIARKSIHSPVIEVGIEFKMAHLRAALEISDREIQELESGMIVDAQKMAQERVENGYLVGFCHGSTLGDARAEQIAKVCASSFQKIHSRGTLHVYLVAPSLTDGILAREFPPCEAQEQSLPSVADSRTATLIADRERGPAPVVDRHHRPKEDHVYSCSTNGKLYLVCGAGRDNSRAVQLGIEGTYFPESDLIPNQQLQPANGNHQTRGCRPNNDQEYEYAPPAGQANPPCPVPCRVLVIRRGGGLTSRVNVVGVGSFNVETRHLKRER